jgi:hypothetical protein
MDMTLETWDPEEHPRPARQFGAVATILNGVDRTGGYSITLRVMMVFGECDRGHVP